MPKTQDIPSVFLWNGLGMDQKRCGQTLQDASTAWSCNGRRHSIVIGQSVHTRLNDLNTQDIEKH